MHVLPGRVGMEVCRDEGGTWLFPTGTGVDDENVERDVGERTEMRGQPRLHPADGMGKKGCGEGRMSAGGAASGMMHEFAGCAVDGGRGAEALQPPRGKRSRATTRASRCRVRVEQWCIGRCIDYRRYLHPAVPPLGPPTFSGRAAGRNLPHRHPLRQSADSPSPSDLDSCHLPPPLDFFLPTATSRTCLARDCH